MKLHLPTATATTYPTTTHDARRRLSPRGHVFPRLYRLGTEPKDLDVALSDGQMQIDQLY